MKLLPLLLLLTACSPPKQDHLMLTDEYWDAWQQENLQRVTSQAYRDAARAEVNHRYGVYDPRLLDALADTRLSKP
jgi:hypothetical protein